MYRDRAPVKTSAIGKVFKDTLKNSGFEENKFSFHGLRAGCGVDLLKLGVSVETIKKLGRWKSNAVFTYLNKFN